MKCAVFPCALHSSQEDLMLISPLPIQILCQCTNTHEQLLLPPEYKTLHALDDNQEAELNTE